MMVKEFYENIHGDYKDMLSRFQSDALILYFVKQFPLDHSYAELMEAVRSRDLEASFAAAHKLKGLAANLSFSELYTLLKELTEQLRPRTAPADPSLLQKISENYQSILREINCLEAGDCG